MITFLMGMLTGAAALWVLLEYREYSEASRIDPKEDEHIP